MTTPLEILDSAVKIGLGALISGVATYLITSRNHAHEFRKAADQDRRELLREAATLIEEATGSVNLATYALEHAPDSRAASEKSLIEAINKIGRAKSLTVLLGRKELVAAIGCLATCVTSLTSYYLDSGEHYRIPQANELLAAINESLPKVYSELEAAYGAR